MCCVLCPRIQEANIPRQLIASNTSACIAEQMTQTDREIHLKYLNFKADRELCDVLSSGLGLRAPVRCSMTDLQETTMIRKKLGCVAAATIVLATTFSACGGGGDDNQTGQSTLEVYAELTQSGIAAITQMQNGNLIIGYHPFYLTP